MSKIGMTTGTAIALSVVVTVFCYQPSHASDALLAKAQAEFTAKARDAVLQRRAAQAPTGMVLASAPVQTQSAPVQTHTVASLEPSALSAPASLEASETTTAPVQAATPDVVEAPVVTAKLPDVDAAVSSETKAVEVRPELKPLPAETAVQNIVAPKQPELPVAAASQVVTPTTNSVAPATVKIQKATREPASTNPAKKTSTIARRFERGLSRERIPYDVQALRARAPEIAAAIARYM